MTTEEENDAVRQWEKDASELYSFALTETGQKQGCLLSISDGLTARFLAESGVDVTGFFHILDAGALRHIHKGHGGHSQPPHRRIVEQDILNLRLILTDPDTITLSPKRHRGLVAVKLVKQISGRTLCCVTTVQRGKSRLSPVTFYKD